MARVRQTSHLVKCTVRDVANMVQKHGNPKQTSIVASSRKACQSRSCIWAANRTRPTTKHKKGTRRYTRTSVPAVEGQQRSTDRSKQVPFLYFSRIIAEQNICTLL